MSHKHQFSSRPTLEAVEKQFESWRKTRRKRTPIPEDLWQAAVDLAKDYSLSQISKALRLSQTKLKEHVSASKVPGLPESSPHPGFVALDFTRPMSACDYVIEMEENNRAKMRIQIKGGSGFDLMGLVQSFWRRSS